MTEEHDPHTIQPGNQAPHRITRFLISDWTWRLFDEDLGGREIDFPALGWRRIWIEELRPEVIVEVREWHFGVSHPDAAVLPALAWHRTSSVDVSDAPFVLRAQSNAEEP